MRIWKTTSLAWMLWSMFFLVAASLPAPPVATAQDMRDIRADDSTDPLAGFNEARLTPEEHRRFLDGLAQARPLPMPNVDPALIAPDSDPGQVIAFDPETGESRAFDAAENGNSTRFWPGSPGTLLEGLPPDGGDGTDGGHSLGGCTAPSQACGTHSYPWRTVVKLMMRFRVGTTDYFYVCSAATVSSFHLITAGHCLYNWDPDGNGNTSDARWADEVWAWPAQTDLVNPFGPRVAGAPVEEDYPWGVAKASRLYSYTGWTQNQDLNHDMGYIRLDRRIGTRVGWMGAEAGVTASSLNFDGYPTETPYVPAGVICPYPGYDANNVTSYTTYRINMCAFTYGGHSGGPVWRYTGTDRYIQGVNSTSNRSGSAAATRLTTGKFADLFDTIIPDDETNNPPIARPELIEYVLDLNAKDVLDNSVPQGTSFQIEYNVFNVGFASSGTITIDFYLSLNTNITTGDYLIGTVTLGSLGANSFYNPTTTRTIPCSVPTGTYYVGYIFSCTGTEYNTDNNVVVIADETVTVTSGLPGTAALVSPANGATCQPTSVLLDWNAASQATSYQVQIGTSCGTGTTYSTSATSYTVTGLANNTTYYWRVRGSNGCGFGSWTSCRTLTTTPATPGVAALVSPADGADCQDTSLTLDWNNVTNAVGYQVQIGTACGSGSTYTTTSSQQAITGLASNTTYYWRVRARNSCNTYGIWSACRSFMTKPAPPAVATLQSPSNGACTPTTVTLNWSNVAGATGYEVQIGSACGQGPVATTTSSQYVATNLPGGTHYWRVRAQDSCGQFGSWSGCWSFNVDTTPPTNPTLASPSHTIGTWSNDNTVDAVWSGAGDNCGVRGYSYLWDTAPGTLPDEVPEGAGTSTTSPALPDGQNHYFHLRTVDVNNNWSGAVHLGPFWIDTTPPANPAMVSSPSHTPGTWSNDNTVVTQWPAAVDPLAGGGSKSHPAAPGKVAAADKLSLLKGAGAVQSSVLGSGIRGYSFEWDTNPTTVPDETADTDELQTTSPPLADGQQHYFHLRAVDLAGNPAVGALHLGPFWIDATPPTDPTDFVTDPTVGQWINQKTISVEWSGHGDNMSGVAGFSILFDQNATTLPDQVIDPTPGNQASAGPPLADGSHWFHLRTRDVAGNWTSTVHVGPFEIDTTPPAAVLLVPNGGEIWNCGEVRTISWDASDATSGLQSIELRYSIDGGATFPHLIANPPVTVSEYDWTVPPDTSSTAMVQVIVLDLANNNRDDASDDVFELSCASAGIPEVAQAPVTNYEFEPNVPNPFNPSTVIRFAVPHDTRVDVAIFDLDGRRIRTLAQGERSGPNRYEVTWDGRDDLGRRVASGIYFYRLQTPDFSQTRRLTLLK